MDIIEHVLSKVGMPYVWGGQGEKGLTDKQIIGMENVQFRVSNPNDYRWFGKIFNYSDIK